MAGLEASKAIQQPGAELAEPSRDPLPLHDLERRYPGITGRILTDEGRLHRFVNLYVNDEDVRYLGSLETQVGEGDTVSILPAVAGG